MQIIPEVTKHGNGRGRQKAHMEEQLNRFISRFNDSLRIAMFLVGANSIEELKESKLVIRGKTREWLNERGINTKNYSRR